MDWEYIKVEDILIKVDLEREIRDNRWSIRDGKRKQGRQKTRWKAEIEGFVRVIWNRQAAGRVEWRRLGEAFVLQ